jgi:RNA polymerase sigma-70 factor (subfamily 1)
MSALGDSMDQDNHDRKEELELLRRFRDGEEDALRLLFERYAHALTGRVRRSLPARVRRRMAVSDVLQEAHIAAFKSRARFTKGGLSAFRNWLLGIVDNKVRETIRFHASTARRAVDREATKSSRPATGALPVSNGSPSRIAIAAETKSQIRDALARLSEDYREVLRLTANEGLNLREASERMGRTYAAVKKLYGRALCRLKETLIELEEKQDGR